MSGQRQSKRLKGETPTTPQTVTNNKGDPNKNLPSTLTNAAGPVPFSKGPCCIGSKCKQPTMELRPEHTCPSCKLICHILCGVFDKATDKYICNNCVESQKSTQSSVLHSSKTVECKKSTHSSVLDSSKTSPLRDSQGTITSDSLSSESSFNANMMDLTADNPKEEIDNDEPISPSYVKSVNDKPSSDNDKDISPSPTKEINGKPVISKNEHVGQVMEKDNNDNKKVSSREWILNSSPVAKKLMFTLGRFQWNRINIFAVRNYEPTWYSYKIDDIEVQNPKDVS